ncbi:MAG: XthA [Oscillospiraceae bacterium]|nr:XthA [Oscillospiraceae bacterium]
MKKLNLRYLAAEKAIFIREIFCVVDNHMKTMVIFFYYLTYGGHFMRFISWNVNGLRACLQKGFADFLDNSSADVFCLQETKLQQPPEDLDLSGWHAYWNYAEKKGYSGTAIFSRQAPLSVTYGPGEMFDNEGRVITAEYDDFYLVNVYAPNSKRELERLDYRCMWEDSFRQYLLTLDAVKPVVLCGDLNVAHREIDLKNPKTNTKNAGFTPQEREKMTLLLEAGFTDSFRHLYPEKTDAYTWWSYMFKAREKNAGWRIDYFITSRRLAERIEDSMIYADILGSDHCPVGLVLR